MVLVLELLVNFGISPFRNFRPI